MTFFWKEFDGDDGRAFDALTVEGGNLFFGGEKLDVVSSFGAKGEAKQPEFATAKSNISPS